MLVASLEIKRRRLLINVTGLGRDHENVGSFEVRLPPTVPVWNETLEARVLIDDLAHDCAVRRDEYDRSSLRGMRASVDDLMSSVDGVGQCGRANLSCTFEPYLEPFRDLIAIRS